MDEISEILREARRIEVRARGMVANEFSGEYRSSFKGRGIDFHDLREYIQDAQVGGRLGSDPDDAREEIKARPLRFRESVTERQLRVRAEWGGGNC